MLREREPDSKLSWLAQLTSPTFKLLLPLCLTWSAIFASPVQRTSRSEASPKFAHQTWQTENGLPQNSVHAITQTKDGYIWVGTEGGLARFDGLSFTVFDSQNTPGLNGNSVRALLEDGEQSLWIGTADGVTRYRDAKFTSFTTSQGLPANDVRSMYLDNAGRFWAVTTDGLAQYRNGQFVRGTENISNGSRITAVALGSGGRMWIADGSTVRAVDQGRSTSFSLPQPLINGTIQTLLADKTDRVWIATSEGLAVLQHDSLSQFKLPERFRRRRITALYEANDGAIWAGTDRGAVRTKAAETQTVSYPDALSGDLILAFFQDREGNIWIGTDSGGLTVLRDQKFRTYASRTAESEDLVRCVFQDRQGSLWAGTNGHGLLMSREPDAGFSAFHTRGQLSSDVVLSLGENASGELLVGTPDGLNILHADAVETLTSADGLPDDFIQSIFLDTDGSVWLGTRRALTHWVNHAFVNFTVAEGLPSEFIGSVLRSGKGELWIGTLRGLAIMKAGKFVPFPITSGSPEPVITSIAEDAGGTLWIGTEQAGLARVADNRAFRLPVSTGLPESVLGILEDANQKLWISSPHGLFSVAESNLNGYAKRQTPSVSAVSYGTADGLQINQFTGAGHPAVWRDHDNTLWFATAKGLVSLDARHASPNPIPPPVVITSILLDDHPVEPKQVRDIAAGLSRITFEFAGLSFVNTPRVTFKYWLEGFDTSWIAAGTRRVAYYTNLAPGRYRFEVQARNSDGTWSTHGAALSFYLQPHFYQRIWFFVLLLLAAASLVYAGYRWRVKQVQGQFEAVLAERTRIAREIHDTLAQSFVAVSMQLELINRLLSTSVESAKVALSETRFLVRDSLAEARRSIWELRSDENASEDLPVKLSKAVKQSTINTALSVRFSVEGAYRRLAPRVEDELLRIGGEAVNNVVRHAGASKLDVILAFGNSEACLIIRDNGRGFITGPRLQSPDGHYGLRGMGERAQSIGAKLSVESYPGEGTTVKLELSLS